MLTTPTCSMRASSSQHLLFRYPQIADNPVGPIWVANHNSGFGVPAFAALKAAALEPSRLRFNVNGDHPRLATRTPRPMNRQQLRVRLSRGRHNVRRLALPRNAVCSVSDRTWTSGNISSYISPVWKAH